MLFTTGVLGALRSCNALDIGLQELLKCSPQWEIKRNLCPQLEIEMSSRLPCCNVRFSSPLLSELRMVAGFRKSWKWQFLKGMVFFLCCGSLPLCSRLFLC